MEIPEVTELVRVHLILMIGIFLLLLLGISAVAL